MCQEPLVTLLRGFFSSITKHEQHSWKEKENKMLLNPILYKKKVIVGFDSRVRSWNLAFLQLNHALTIHVLGINNAIVGYEKRKSLVILIADFPKCYLKSECEVFIKGFFYFQRDKFIFILYYKKVGYFSIGPRLQDNLTAECRIG